MTLDTGVPALEATRVFGLLRSWLYADQDVAVRELVSNAAVNRNGGALAMGHPLGAIGAVLTCKALAELAETGGRRALVTMCVGGGMGAAGVIELV